jgi:CheY-like chemotaxis protein
MHAAALLNSTQMPIVDGLTSTKHIRSFESTHGFAHLSPRASLNGRVPIIAVSASLVEKERDTYTGAGFDGWILKPISFQRLSEIMNGIVDDKVRESLLYEPGQWEKGGWFTTAQPEKWRKKGAAAEGAPAPEGAKEGIAPAADGTLKGEKNEPLADVTDFAQPQPPEDDTTPKAEGT